MVLVVACISLLLYVSGWMHGGCTAEGEGDGSSSPGGTILVVVSCWYY
jgi:hypothetical protein